MYTYARRNATAPLRAVHNARCYATSSTGVPALSPLFGVEFLRKPEDFPRAAAIAVKVCNPLIESIVKDKQVGLSTLHKLDTISDTICKVLDAAECCRNVHASPEWREAAENTFQSLSGYMYQLNAFKPLYDALAAVTDDSAVMCQLSEEQRRMGIMLRREFERDGIHLGQEARDAIVKLNSGITATVSTFLGNLHGPPSLFEVKPVGEVGALPAHVRARLPSRGAQEMQRVWLSTDAVVTNHILNETPSADIRKQVMIAVHQDKASNLKVLAQLRRERQTLARSIGFPSYAHMVTSDRLASTPEHAVQFLQNVSKAILPRAAAELLELAAAKVRAGQRGRVAINDASGSSSSGSGSGSGSSSSSSSSPSPMRAVYDAVCSTHNTDVAPWDAPYYIRQVLRDRFDSPTDQGGSCMQEAAAYFPLSAVLHGLQSIMKKVFGVTMVRIPVEASERWTGGPGSMGSGVGGSSSTLVKLVLRHDLEGALGTLYLDLFARPHKFGGAAHFVVRCGKRLHPHDGTFEAELGLMPQVAAEGGRPGQSFQLPIITLVTNYPPPPAASSSASLGSRIAGAVLGGGSAGATDPLSSVLMTPTDVETLFHEWGHALHSLLSRTEFQHLSGTRGALDFVELPSHLMEYWARDFRSVRSFARHHITGAPMPEELWKRVQETRADFSALSLQSTVVHALFDLALFGSAHTRQAVLQGLSMTPEQLAALTASLTNRASTAGHARLPAGYLTADEMRVPLPPPHSIPHMPTAATAAAMVAKAAAAGAAAGEDGAEEDGTALLAAVHSKYALLPHVPGSKWHASMSHLATYGGGYYSYVYATAFAAAVWSKLFAADPFSRAAGETYRREILSKGAAADPAAMLQQVLGEAPSLVPLLKEMDLIQ